VELFECGDDLQDDFGAGRVESEELGEVLIGEDGIVVGDGGPVVVEVHDGAKIIESVVVVQTNIVSVDGEACAFGLRISVDAGFEVVGGGAVVGVADEGGELEMGQGGGERQVLAGGGEGGFVFVPAEGAEALIGEEVAEGEVEFGRGIIAEKDFGGLLIEVLGFVAIGGGEGQRDAGEDGRGLVGGVEGAEGSDGRGEGVGFVEDGDDGPADGVGRVFSEEADDGGEAGAVGEFGEHGDVVDTVGGVVLAVFGEDALDFAGVGGGGPREFEDQVGGAGADFRVRGSQGGEDDRTRGEA
jgi:hypothetical protein